MQLTVSGRLGELRPCPWHAALQAASLTLLEQALTKSESDSTICATCYFGNGEGHSRLLDTTSVRAFELNSVRAQTFSLFCFRNDHMSCQR